MKPKQELKKEKSGSSFLSLDVTRESLLLALVTKFHLKGARQSKRWIFLKQRDFQIGMTLCSRSNHANAAMRTMSCVANLCTSTSTSGVLKRCTNAMIVQTSDIYKMGKYLHNTRVNLPSYCTFCVMIV